jgi:S1-C subfamily serine protease
VRGDLLDIVLLVAVALFALSGYRQGFVVGALSFLGFLGGGVLGAKLAPAVVGLGPVGRLPSPVVALAVVLVAASVGQLLATLIGSRLRARLTWRPVRVVDAVAGALVSAVSVLLVAWLVGTAVASSPFTTLAGQVRRSQVIATVDGTVPAPGKRFFADFRRLVDTRGFPDVFGDLAPTDAPAVEPPDPKLATSKAVTQARPSVLKITGVARSCSRRIEGTGFVFAPERVMTNAHVVAGVRDPTIQVGSDRLKAKVVLYDPQRDVAVLYVPGLSRPALGFSGPAARGDSAIVVGYPEDGPFRADAARVRGTQNARGPDIYQRETVTREVYALYARVRPGNSGGPLLDTGGKVEGVVFAAAADASKTGYALTAGEVASDAAKGRSATEPVSTQNCD